MDFSCYINHNSDFEPKDCAEYFKTQGLNVTITSDFSDDALIITTKEDGTGKSYVFESNKMDRALYKHMLDNYPDLEPALKNCNALAVVATKNPTEKALAITLLSYLHNKHAAKIFNDYQKRALGSKKLKELRENAIKELFSRSPLSFREFAEKYHLSKVIISLILLIGYFIFDSKVQYSTDVFFFIIILGILILWVHS